MGAYGWTGYPHMRPDGQLSFSDDEYSLAARRAWERAAPLLANKVSKITYESYIRPMKAISLRDRELVLGIDTGFAREWVEKKCVGFIKTAVETVVGYSVEVTIELLAASQRSSLEPDDADPLAPASESVKTVEAPRVRDAAFEAMRNEISLPLSDKFTFDTFVVGPSNRLAMAAAQEVAAQPGRLYNPLFMYGPSGLGKTHLLHSIGRHIMATWPECRLIMVDGETFTHHYVAFLRDRKGDRFRRFFRSVDVWLVDDIEFLAGKEHTKEEFFHTFNALHQGGRQIVLTSNRSPRELRSMDDRLRTRFEAGLIADIAPPSLETRVAILQSRCRAENWDVPSEVLFFIADAIQSNVRALEGAVTRLVVNSSVLGAPMDIELAQSVLTHFFIDKRATSRKPRVPMEAIMGAVADAFGLTSAILLSQRRDRRSALARQVAMYLCRELA
ncbi:MAG: chromosomal replication initiator protein DnaA, partial [Armatimonadetes bacterium]|nr:chromosomal replication initiator protein DnaA [Armatimonadota bacterium]